VNKAVNKVVNKKEQLEKGLEEEDKKNIPQKVAFEFKPAHSTVAANFPTFNIKTTILKCCGKSVFERRKGKTF
jgi:hypothetical protein